MTRLRKIISKRGERSAVERPCGLLGQGYEPRRMDGEICPYRRIDEDYDLEVSGYVRHVNDRLGIVMVVLWDVSRGLYSGAREVATVREVPNTPGEIRWVCDLLAARRARLASEGYVDVRYPELLERGW